MENSHEITLETYKELTKIEFLPWDEMFDSIITNYDEELHYSCEQQRTTPELVEYFDKKKKKWH